MSLQRQIRRRMGERSQQKRSPPIDLVAHAEATQRLDRFHARIYAHGTTISPSGITPAQEKA